MPTPRDWPYRLGRLPHDDAAIARAPQHTMKAGAPVPPVLNRSHIPYAPGLYHNDTLGNCTAAGLANAALAFALARSGFAPVIEPDKVVDFYALCVGNPPDLVAAEGCVELDVLTRASTDGVDFGQQVPLGLTYGVADPKDRSEIAHITLTYGSAYIGITLTERDMDTIAAGGSWDDDGSDASPPAGGHCLLVWDYLGLKDTDPVRLATWGQLQTATWRWLGRRLVEAYAISWPQLVGPQTTVMA